MNDRMPWQLSVGELREALEGEDAESVIALILTDEDRESLDATHFMAVHVNLEVVPGRPRRPLVPFRIKHNEQRLPPGTGHEARLPVDNAYRFFGLLAQSVGGSFTDDRVDVMVQSICEVQEPSPPVSIELGDGPQRVTLYGRIAGDGGHLLVALEGNLYTCHCAYQWIRALCVR